MRGLGISTDSPTVIGGVAHVKYIKATEPEIREGNSPNEAFDNTMAEATRVFDVAWTDRLQACFQTLGFPIRELVGGVPYIRRYLPEFHPEAPWLTATKIASVKGVGTRGYQDIDVSTVPAMTMGDHKRIAKYAFARITVHYDFPSYDVLADTTQFQGSTSDGTGPPSGSGSGGGGAVYDPTHFAANEFYRFVTTELKPAAEYLSVPQSNGVGCLQWTNDPGPPPVDNPAQDVSHIGVPFKGNVGQIIGNIDFKWTWHQIPFECLPMSVILDTLGRANSDQFGNLPPGSLLLLAVDLKRQNSPYGLRTWDIQYTARYNPRLHNRFYDFITGRWCEASKDGTYYDPASGLTGSPPPNGKLLYDYRPFWKLFNVA
jgi:hypothetical protein